MEQRDQRKKELRAVEDTGFTVHEVEEFRELFLASGDGNSLSFQDLRKMLCTICPLGDKNATELNGHLRKITQRRNKAGGVEDISDMDFPEFLWLMHRLLDTNFA